MPDRIIRDELLESARFVKLPSDTDRMAYIGLRLRSDDFGNIEGGLWRIYRLLERFTQIKTEEAAAGVLNHLVDADLIRGYTVDGREFFHLPRSRPTGSYLVRKCPPSPWCDPDVRLGKHVRAVRKQGLAKNVPVTSPEHNKDVSPGIGVGTGTGTGKTQKDIVGLTPDVPQKINGKAHQTKALNAAAVGLIAFLNEKTGSRYEPVAANVKLIVARLQEGFTEKQVRQVIANRCLAWANDPKMDEYLRPKTLFNATNFANYVGQLGKETKERQE